MNYRIIQIQKKTAAWRSDQIAGIELKANVLTVVAIGMSAEQHTYSFNKTSDAENAYKALLEAWTSALAAASE